MTLSEPLERLVGLRLSTTKRTLATAESCSGGLLAHLITNVPGASEYFLGGAITYANEAKIELLGVSERDLSQHGAVSETVARQMAEGARVRFGADLGLGITGIAGPGGGTPEKPVGLVFVALSYSDGFVVSRNEFSGTREEIKRQSAEQALKMLWESLS